MGIGITIYNDDRGGRAIQVMKVNPRAGGVFERKLLQPTDDGHGDGPYCVEITQDEMLIVLPAEPVVEEPKKAEGDGT